MKLKPSKLFIFTIFANAFGMESIGTYISVFGLGALFASDPIILTMAVILDIAKVVTVSFLYQYWDRIKSKFKYYMLAAVIVLMTITSVGTFGYLSGAFQKAVQPVMEVTLKVESYQHEQASLIAERDSLKTEQADMDKQVAQLPSNYIRGRQRLIYSFKPEQERIRSRLNTINKRNDELTADILKVQSENIDQNVHAGPIIYVAKAFNISIEEASKWVIMILIFVFDPLATGLLLAGNFLVKLRHEANDEEPPVQFPLPDSSWSHKDDDDIISKRGEIYIPTEVEEGPPTPEQVVAQEFTEALSPEFKEKFPFEVVSVDDEGEVIPEEVTIVTPQSMALSDHVIENVTLYEPTLLQKSELNGSAVENFDFLKEETVEEQLTAEERQLLSLVYDDIDTGEEPDYNDEVDTSVFVEMVQDYVPSNPIEVNGDMTYSGSPQADLIDETKKSSLEELTINMPEALLSGVKTSSMKKALYE
jgi:cell division protein FtsB